MPNIQISQLPSLLSVSATDQLHVKSGSNDHKVSFQNLQNSLFQTGSPMSWTGTTTGSAVLPIPGATLTSTASYLVVVNNDIKNTSEFAVDATNDTITLNSAPGAGVEWTVYSLGTTGTQVVSEVWSQQSGDFNADANTNYFVDTGGAAVNVTLPASPAFGDKIIIADLANTFDTNNCIIQRNGNNIEGSPNNLVINVAGESTTLVFSDVTNGWQVI